MALRSIGTTDTLETFRTTTNSHISDVGDLASLDTTEKGSIVGAINEVNTAGGNWNISDSTSTIENIASGGTLNVIGGTGITANADDIAIDSTVATLTGSQTLTNKSIDLGNNTLTGSLAEFNSALQSESFASLTGSETLTNKTLTTPIIAEIDASTITNISSPIIF